MTHYRKKPVIIEAFKLGHEDIPSWIAQYIKSGIIEMYEGYWLIKTLEGEMRAKDGDYIIKGVKNELYPCRGDIFEETYEKAD